MLRPLERSIRGSVESSSGSDQCSRGAGRSKCHFKTLPQTDQNLQPGQVNTITPVSVSVGT